MNARAAALPEPSGRAPSDLSDVDATRLSRVWPGGGLASAGTWQPGDEGDVLRHQLAAPLDGLDGAAGASPQFPASPAGRSATFADLLMRATDPRPEQLRRVKDWAKPLMGRDDGEVPREVAGVLYFAAILAARLRLGRRISDLADEDLRDGARWALRLAWLDPTAAELFRDALVVLGAGAEPGPV